MNMLGTTRTLRTRPGVAAAAAGLLALGATPALADDAPWYDRPSCHDAVLTMMAPDFAAAEAKIMKLERSADTDDQACALWARASWSEFQIAILGKTPDQLANRKKALSRLFAFAKANKAKGARFGDLELEARLRRIRVLNEEGQRTQSLEDLKALEKLIVERGNADLTPPADYAVGLLNAALSSPGWAARALLSVVGMSTDPAVAAQRLHKLIDGSTVYGWDARYVAQFFGTEIGSKDFRGAAAYLAPLATKFPTNPLFAYEQARLHINDKKGKEAQAVLAPVLAQLDAQPTIWGPPARARVSWAAGRAALLLGDKAGATKRAAQAKAERQKDMQDRIDDLVDDAED